MTAITLSFAIALRISRDRIKLLEQRVDILQSEVRVLSDAIEVITESHLETRAYMIEVVEKVEYFGNTVYQHIQVEEDK
jgi:uncharacterized membrane protein YecN with MAPEG domain